MSVADEMKADKKKLKTDVHIFQRQKFIMFLLCLALLSFCFQVKAQIRHIENRAFNIEEWNEPIVKGSPTTYLELLQKVFPGIDGEDSEPIIAEGTIRFRHLEHPKEVTERDGTIEISNAQALWIADETVKRLALLINARHTDKEGSVEEFNLLATFSFRPALQLIDAAEVDFDRWVDFWDKSPLLPLHPGDTAFWLRATHHNSSEGFHLYTLIELRDNRLRVILDESFGLINEKLCGSETVQTLRIERESGSVRGYPIYDMLVRTEIRVTDSCVPAKPVNSRYKNQFYRLRWNASQKRYLVTPLKTTSGKLFENLKPNS